MITTTVIQSNVHTLLLYTLLLVLLLLLPTPTLSGWIDPDTPPKLLTTKSLLDKTEYKLVMSDEFETQGRTFADGHDKGENG